MKTVPKWRSETTKIRWAQQGGLCHYCARPMHQTGNSPARSTIDHIKPKSHNGTNEPHNLILCCRACNEEKADLRYAKWDKILSARFADQYGS